MQKRFAKGSALGHDKAKKDSDFNANRDAAPGCFLLEDSIVDLSWKFSCGTADYLGCLCLQSLTVSVSVGSISPCAFRTLAPSDLFHVNS